MHEVKIMQSVILSSIVIIRVIEQLELEENVLNAI